MCGAAAYLSARLAWADHLSRSQSLADRQHAVVLAPTPVFFDRLASKREQLGGDPLPDLQQAVKLEPDNADRRLRLAARAELAGKFDLAESSFLAAVERSRQYQPRYLLANYYFRRQNADLFWRWSREALQTAYGEVSPLLELRWRMVRDCDRMAREALDLNPQVARQVLVFLARRQTSGAVRSLALHLAKAAQTEDLPALYAYCDEGLGRASASGPLEVWNWLRRRGLVLSSELDPERGLSLTNALFPRMPTGRAFDWRVQSVPGVSWRIEGGLQLDLTGQQPERCLIAWEYVPVIAGMKYRIPALHVANDNAAGLEWMMFDVTGKPLAADRLNDGSQLFRASADVLRMALFYRRPAGRVRLAGRVTVTEARLEILP